MVEENPGKTPTPVHTESRKPFSTSPFETGKTTSYITQVMWNMLSRAASLIRDLAVLGVVENPTKPAHPALP